MPTENVLFEKKDHVAIITLNRPEVLNAMTSDMFSALRSIGSEVDEDDHVRAIVLTGSGRGFCSGVDVGGDRDFSSSAGRRPTFGAGDDFVSHLRNIKKPTIAAVNGAAVGAGFSLALACDIRLASEQARFSAIFTSIGIPALDGTAWMLPRIVGQAKALELIYSSEIIGADEAERIGLVTYVTPPEKLLDRSLELATKFARNPPLAVQLSKSLVRQGLGIPYEAYQPHQANASLNNRTFAAHDIQEAARARQEKREPRFRGLEAT